MKSWMHEKCSVDEQKPLQRYIMLMCLVKTVSLYFNKFFHFIAYIHLLFPTFYLLLITLLNDMIITAGHIFYSFSLNHTD